MEEQACAERGVATEGGRGHGHGWGILLVLFGMLVAYALSIGPAAKLVEMGLISKRVIYFYLPLDALCRGCPPVSRFVDWYIEDVWGIKSVGGEQD